MRDLYNQLIADGEAAIAQLVSERRQENVSLEFKTKDKAGSGECTKADKQNLGIALSAFSNSMGGLIVWGVVAKKDEDDVDCATGLQPIANIERFKADVTRLISQAVMPRHEGIFVEAIPAEKSTGAGYLAIYVERSERRPHRCELGVGRYFKRIGDSSVAMEHYDIEDSFKRFIVPWLEIECHVTPGMTRGGPDGTFRQIVIDIYLRNPSPVTARFPYLILSNLSGAEVHPSFLFTSGKSSGLGFRADRGLYHFSGGADDIVHPGLALPAAQLLTSEIAVEITLPLGHMVRTGASLPEGRGYCYIRRGSLQPVSAAYQCGCYNSRPATGKFSVSEDELVERGIPGGFIY